MEMHLHTTQPFRYSSELGVYFILRLSRGIGSGDHPLTLRRSEFKIPKQPSSPAQSATRRKSSMASCLSWSTKRHYSSLLFRWVYTKPKVICATLNFNPYI